MVIDKSLSALDISKSAVVFSSPFRVIPSSFKGMILWSTRRELGEKHPLSRVGVRN